MPRNIYDKAKTLVHEYVLDGGGSDKFDAAIFNLQMDYTKESRWEEVDDYTSDYIHAMVRMLQYQAVYDPHTRAVAAFGPKETRPAVAYDAAQYNDAFLRALDYWCRKNNITDEQYKSLHRVLLVASDEPKVLKKLPCTMRSLNVQAKKALLPGADLDADLDRVKKPH